MCFVWMNGWHTLQYYCYIVQYIIITIIIIIIAVVITYLCFAEHIFTRGWLAFLLALQTNTIEWIEQQTTCEQIRNPYFTICVRLYILLWIDKRTPHRLMELTFECRIMLGKNSIYLLKRKLYANSWIAMIWAKETCLMSTLCLPCLMS